MRELNPNGATRGAVMLSREMRLRLDRPYSQALADLATRHGWSSATEFAEALLRDAIERVARNTAMDAFLHNVRGAWCA